jgi:hypothetical protein
MDACLEGARASFLATPAFALPGAAATAAPAQSGPEQKQEDGDVLQLRQEIERLRKDNERIQSILDGIRGALNSAATASTGG